MLAQELRPRRFRDVVGQDLNKEILSSIASNPKTAPRVWVFEGAYGCGKTTCARILAKALNCKNNKSDPCLECDHCRQRDEHNAFYQEYDSTDVGNIASIRNMKDDLISKSDIVEWRVITFDEAHSISQQGMNALLKVLEEIRQNTFVIFCTTEVDRILDTVRSRSIELTFHPIPLVEIFQHLRNICNEHKIEVDDSVLRQIVFYSRGHMRDAIMKLDQYRLMNDKTIFSETVSSSIISVIEMLIQMKQGNRQSVQEAINKVVSHPLAVVKLDYFEVIHNMIRMFVTGAEEPKIFKQVTTVYDRDSFRLFKMSTDTWALNSFSGDLLIQSFFWTLYYTLKDSGGVGSLQSKRDRAVKK